VRALYLIDSISEITAAMGGGVVVSGSHGGRSAAMFALAVRPAPHAVFFNDAGVGKDGAGIVALPALEQAGIVAAAYGHDSARIGDALDGFECGVVTALNPAAVAAGLAAGQTVTDAVSVLRSGAADGGTGTTR
jgi:hypothetical protein